MSERFHGNPCWYELATRQGDLPAAEAFYAAILDWTVADAGMEGFAYHLATSQGDLVAGLMEMPDDVAGMPPRWTVYFSVADADRFVAEASAAGAAVHRPPVDIPGTGRIAILADPQGAGFGILQPDLGGMSEADLAKVEAGDAAFSQGKAGHGAWHELMTPDPEAGFAFYSALLGWSRGESMDMGEMGRYQLFRRKDVDLGGMMGLGGAPVPNWAPYFAVDGALSAKLEQVREAGGRVDHGPVEVPGPAWVAMLQDPQGAWFALVAPEP